MSLHRLSVPQCFGRRPVVVLAVVGKGVGCQLVVQGVAAVSAIPSYAEEIGAGSQVRSGHGARCGANAFVIALYHVGLVFIVGVERQVPHVQCERLVGVDGDVRLSVHIDVDVVPVLLVRVVEVIVAQVSPRGLSVLQPFGRRPVVVLAVVGKGVRGVLAGQRVATRFAVAAYAYEIGTGSQVRGGHGARCGTNAFDIALYNIRLVSIVGVERHVPHVQFSTWSYRQIRLSVF